MSENSIQEFAQHLEGLSLKKQNIFAINLIEKILGERNCKRNELIAQSEEIRREIQEIDESISDLYLLILSIPGTEQPAHNDLVVGRTLNEFEEAANKKGVTLISINFDENQLVTKAVGEIDSKYICFDKEGRSQILNLWN